jgi:hypothetical protein
VRFLFFFFLKMTTTLGDLFTIKDEYNRGLAHIAVTLPFLKNKEVVLMMDNSKNTRFLVNYKDKEELVRITFNKNWQYDLAKLIGQRKEIPKRKITLSNVTVEVNEEGEVFDDSLQQFLDLVTLHAQQKQKRKCKKKSKALG